MIHALSRQIGLELSHSGKLVIELALQGERLAETGLVAREPRTGVLFAPRLFFPLRFKALQRVFEAGDQTHRCLAWIDRKLMVVVGASQDQTRLETVGKGAPGVADKLESADCSDRVLPNAPRALGKSDLRQQQRAGDAPVGDNPILQRHRERVAPRGRATREILGDTGQPVLRRRNVAARVGDLPTNVELIVKVRDALAFRPGNLAG